MGRRREHVQQGHHVLDFGGLGQVFFLSQIGGNARRFAQEQYSWQAAAGKMKLAYDWLVHGGTVPECIRL